MPLDGDLDYQEKRFLKHKLANNYLDFTRYFFKKRDSAKFKVAPHHRLLADIAQGVVNGTYKRIIINIPPGYTKTEMFVNFLAAYGFAINPGSKFIHTSYADDLVMLNSSVVKDLCQSPEFQMFWPMQLKKDTTSKKLWFTDAGGAFLARPADGGITGFRAGRMEEGFSGAFIVDDPLKPLHAYSAIRREKINNQFTNTFKSRLAHEDIPIIIIMQRLHEDDPTGFLLRGGTGEYWHHLVIPVNVPEQGDEPEYPKEYTHGIPIPHGLAPGPIWPYKHRIEHIKQMEDSDPYTYASQYDQRPAPLGGGLFEGDWWQFYKSEGSNVLAQIEYRFITADTAQKTEEHHDFTVFQLWGVFQGDLYLIDQVRGKFKAPELRSQLIAFWNKHVGSGIQTRGVLRDVNVEDKVSGTGLIQDIINDKSVKIPINAIQRNKDKVTRAMDVVPHIKAGHVYIPEDQSWASGFLAECAKFTPMLTHSHDDQIDAMMDAISIALSTPQYEAGAIVDEDEDDYGED